MIAFKTTSPEGFHVTFGNGWTVSVQWGAGTYAGPGAAETAVINPDGDFVKRRRGDGDDVQGWQSPEQVAATMLWASRKPAPADLVRS